MIASRVRLHLLVTFAAWAAPAIATAQPLPPPPPSAPPDEGTPVEAAPPPAVPPAERPPETGAVQRPPPEPTISIAGFSWQPFGFLREEYEAVQNDPNVAYVGRNDGFAIQNARIGARGQLGTRATFVLSFDGAIDQRTQLNVPQGTLGVGMRDSYLDVVLQGRIVARGGYWQSWLDPEAQVPDTVRAFVDYPLESRGVRATEGYQTPPLPPGRSMGAGIRLDPEVPESGARFGFELAAQNGADEFSSQNDNDTLALSAAGIVRFPHDGYLVIAGRWNPRTIGMLPFRQDETDLQASIGARVVLGPVELAGGAIVQQTSFDTTAGPTQNGYGAHGQIMFRIPARLPLAVGYRFGVLDPSSLITTDQVMEHTVGAVLGVPSLRVRVQLQYVHPVEQAGRELSNDRVQLAGEVVL
jgi:hypothetical protein